MDELKTLPNEPNESAPALAARALDQELGAPSAVPAAPTQVNDLTAMVKKKKKPPVDVVPDVTAASAANGSTKRKADDEEAPSEKKPRIEETSAS